MANSPIKNLMVKIHDILAAESDVTDLLLKGADDIVYWINPQTQIPAIKPYISISPVSVVREEVHGATRHVMATEIMVEYVIDDQVENSQLDFLDDVEKIELVLIGTSLDDPAFGNDLTFNRDDGYEIEYLIEDGVKKAQFTMTYTYYKDV